MVTTADHIKDHATEKPIRLLESAIIACLLSHYDDRAMLPDLQVRVGDGKLKILVADFHTPDERYGDEIETLRENCDRCYIIGLLKIPYIVGCVNPNGQGGNCH